MIYYWKDVQNILSLEAKLLIMFIRVICGNWHTKQGGFTEQYNLPSTLVGHNNRIYTLYRPAHSLITFLEELKILQLIEKNIILDIHMIGGPQKIHFLQESQNLS